MTLEGEEKIVQAAMKGDAAARDTLLREYKPRIYKFVTLMGVQDIEDVVQESLGESLRSLASFKGKSKFSSWILSVALNQCRRWHRARHAKMAALPSENLDRLDPKPTHRSVLSSLVKKESAERVMVALDRLPPIFREAFVLKHGEGLDYKEIAEITEVTTVTARVRAHRAKAILQSELGSSFQTLLNIAQKDDE